MPGDASATLGWWDMAPGRASEVDWTAMKRQAALVVFSLAFFLAACDLGLGPTAEPTATAPAAPPPPPPTRAAPAPASTPPPPVAAATAPPTAVVTVVSSFPTSTRISSSAVATAVARAKAAATGTALARGRGSAPHYARDHGGCRLRRQYRWHWCLSTQDAPGCGSAEGVPGQHAPRHHRSRRRSRGTHLAARAYPRWDRGLCAGPVHVGAAGSDGHAPANPADGRSDAHPGSDRADGRGRDLPRRHGH